MDTLSPSASQYRLQATQEGGLVLFTEGGLVLATIEPRIAEQLARFILDARTRHFASVDTNRLMKVNDRPPLILDAKGIDK